MSLMRSLLALCALGLCSLAGHAQTTPAVSTVVAFSLSNPVGNVVKGEDGALYGTALPVTSIAGGIVWRSAVDGSEVRTLYQLGPDDAISPGAGLTLASDGLLYGTTRFGKASDILGTGSVFRISPDGTGFQIIFRFAATTGSNVVLSPRNTNGAYPESELTEGNDGYLYGVASAGGPEGTGTIFKLSKDGTDFQLLKSFSAVTSTLASGLTVTADGAVPTGPLALGADGFFYGTTTAGGPDGRGAIFRIGFDGSGFEVLRHFSATTADATTGLLENADGATPLGGLIDGGDGVFYGTTTQGGTEGHGVIYSITPAGEFNVLHVFNNADGSRPLAELLLGTDGKLYGTTAAGGVNSAGTTTSFGTIFSIGRDGTGFTRLYSFDGTQGSTPSSKLLQLANGVFVGLATASGNCGYGTLFRYSEAGDTLEGNRRCGVNNNNNGGGTAGLGLLALLGALALGRRRRRD